MNGEIVGGILPLYYIVCWTINDRKRVIKCLTFQVKESRRCSTYYVLHLTPFTLWFCIIVLVASLWLGLF